MASGLPLDSTTNPFTVTQTPSGQPSATFLVLTDEKSAGFWFYE
jgi:hypothetical protein